MAKIKTSAGQVMVITDDSLPPRYGETLVPGKLIRKDIQDYEFPIVIEKSVRIDKYEMTHKYEVRISKRGTLSMHHMGMVCRSIADLKIEDYQIENKSGEGK